MSIVLLAGLPERHWTQHGDRAASLLGFRVKRESDARIGSLSLSTRCITVELSGVSLSVALIGYYRPQKAD